MTTVWIVVAGLVAGLLVAVVWEIVDRIRASAATVDRIIAEEVHPAGPVFDCPDVTR